MLVTRVMLAALGAAPGCRTPLAHSDSLFWFWPRMSLALPTSLCRITGIVEMEMIVVLGVVVVVTILTAALMERVALLGADIQC